MDGLHLSHLIFICIWAGLVIAESVIEVLSTSDQTRAQAAKIHFWIDVLFEIPVILAVLVTGIFLVRQSLPLTPLHLLKIAAASVAIVLNLYCAVMVIFRYLHLDDPAAVRQYHAQVRLSALGIPFALLAAYIGFAYFQ